MTDNNSVKEDAKDPRSVEAHRDPDELLRGLNSEDQGEGNGADPDQEFHDLGVVLPDMVDKMMYQHA